MGIVAACGMDGTQVGSDAVVQDSAGVSIVTYPSGIGSAPEWILAEEPTVEIGEVDGQPEMLFSRVVTAFEGIDGTIVVGDATSREIRWFDEDGRHIRTIGGRGDGPGEFRSISNVERLGADTILVWDEIGRRLSFFSNQGDFLSSELVGPVLGAVEGSFDAPPPGRMILPLTPWVLGFFRDGSVLAHPLMAYMDVPAGVYRDSVPLLRFDRSLMDWERIGTMLPGEAYYDPNSDVIMTLPLPFGIRTQAAVADEWVVIGWGDEAGISVLNSTGQAESIIRPGFLRVPISQDEIEEDRNARIEARGETDREQFRRELQAVEYPTHRPAHGRIVAGEEEFWVESSVTEADQDARLWFVFSRSGQVLGSVRIPNSLNITDVQRDNVVGVVTDELGVPKVMRFALQRGT